MRQPIKFLPYLKPTDWGGEGISRFKGIRINCKNIGESWELSAVPGCESIVMDGIDCGMTLTDMVTKYKERLVGDSVYNRFGNQFPLVVKLIDNKDNLSVEMLPLRDGYNDGVSAGDNAPLPVGLTEELSKTAYTESAPTENLISSEYFQVRREIIDGERRLTNDYDSFMGLVCVEGTGSLKVDGVSTSVRQGESLLLPAHTDEFDVEGTLALLTVVVPTLMATQNS